MSMRRRARGKQDKGWQTFLVAVAALTILLGGGVFAAYKAITKRPVDRATSCPTDHYDSVTAVLVDLTDTVNPIQAAALRNVLLKVRSDVPKYGRLEIYPLTPTTTSTITPLFVGCSPGSAREVESRMTGTPELADRIWHTKFASKVDEVVEELLKTPDAKYSPIFEAIQSVAVTAFGTPMAKNAPAKRLVIISDMIQHTTEFSLYQGAPPFDQVKDSQYFLRVRPSLQGAYVDVSLIVRETRKDILKPVFLAFWSGFLKKGDGQLDHWEPMQ